MPQLIDYNLLDGDVELVDALYALSANPASEFPVDHNEFSTLNSSQWCSGSAVGGA